MRANVADHVIVRPDVRIGFEGFTLDLDARQLTASGREIHLAPKALELLTMLVLERPKAVSKDVLQERLWPDTFVVDANLSNLIGEIRSALGDSLRAPERHLSRRPARHVADATGRWRRDPHWIRGDDISRRRGFRCDRHADRERRSDRAGAVHVELSLMDHLR